MGQFFVEKPALPGQLSVEINIGGPYRPDSIASIVVDRSQRGLRWSASFECGNAVIDREHCQLFALTDTILTCGVTSKAQLETFWARLDVLLSHVASHFRDEEAELAARGYRDLSKHKTVHAGLLGRVNRLKTEVRNGQRTVGDLREFIVNVIVFQHMMTSDREFFPLFEADPPAAKLSRATPEIAPHRL